jgi:hypothetical protein
MEPEDKPAMTLMAAFEGPVLVVLLLCQMVLGLGLAVTIILKIYMLVFTDQTCVPDGETLGNLIRCTPTLAIVAQYMMAIAAFRMAAQFFSVQLKMILEPLLIGVAGVLAMVLSGVTFADANWQASLMITAIFAVLGGGYLGLRFLRDRN